MGVKLNWDDQSDQNLDRIEIYRSTVKADIQKPESLLKTLAGNITAYEDNTVLSKNIYYYRIAAVKGTEYAWGETQVAGYFSETGPGRAVPLRGDWNAGYMDRIPVANFITGPDLRLKVPELAAYGTIYNPANWYKMVHKGKVIFVPDNYIFQASPQEIYNAGLMFGTDDVGTFPVGEAVGTKKQRYVININGLEYIIRLPRMSNIPYTEFLTTAAQMVGSEWKDCISRLAVTGNASDATMRTRLYDANGLTSVCPHRAAAGRQAQAISTNVEVPGTNLVITTRQATMLVLELVMP